MREAAAQRRVLAEQAAAARVLQSQEAEQARALAGVKRSLMTQEQLIRQSENERRRIIITSTEVTEAQRRELLLLSAAKTNAELKAINSGKAGVGVGGLLAGGMAAAPLMVAAGTAIAGMKCIEVTREFDRISAGLDTATGSAKKAEQAFDALSDFAQKTPYSLRETTDSFVKLVNFGLNPSERAMKSYGDTSAALGRNLNQMIEAIADATVGEFERLKEFGIKARTQGDNIQFTFRGVATSVKNNASDIEEYLIKLGENNFSGAMAKRMATLDGALSNLGDAFDKFMRTLAKVGLEEWLSKQVTALSNFLDWLGRAVEKLNSLKLPELAKGSKAAVLMGETSGWKQSDDMLYGVKRMFQGTGDLIDTNEADLKRSNDIRNSEQQEIDRLRKFGVEQSKIQQGRYKDDLEKLRVSLRTKREVIEDDFRKQKEIVDKAMLGDPIGAKAAYARAVAERAEKLKALNKKGGKKGYDLSEHSTRPEDPTVHRLGAPTVDDAELEKLMTSGEKNPTEAMMDRLAREVDAERRAAEEKQRVHDDAMATFLNDNDRMIEDERRKLQEFQKLRDQDVISAGELEQLKLQLHADTNKRLNELEATRVQNSVQSAEALFGSLSEASKNWGGEQSKAYQVMFSAQKAFAVASASVSMAVGMGKAMELGWPAGIPAGLAAAAEGAKIIAMISGMNYAGAHDWGGRIPAGSVGLVGERGPELVRGPASVTSRADTAKMLGGGEAPRIMMNVGFDPHEAVNRYMSSTRGTRTINTHITKNWRTVRAIGGTA